VIEALTVGIAQRFSVDPVDDPRPYLAATMWIAAFDWYRRRSVAHEVVATGIDAVLDDLTAAVTSVHSVFVTPTP
jgi:hypothetical protein